MVQITKAPFGKALNPLTTKPADVFSYTLTNDNNVSVVILTRGATVQSIKTPDKFGNIDDVCLGFDTLQPYIDYKNLYMGAVVGRVANRISDAKFVMDCKEYCLTKNYKDKYQINGGFNGFDTMIWDMIKEKPNGIVLQHINPHGMEGYPGKLNATVTYTLDDCNNFRMCFEATSNKKTPVNMSNYLYLNLAGHHSRKEGLFEHNIKIRCSKIVETDKERIPTGCLMPVKHSPYDLRKYVNLGKRLKKFFTYPIKGFDDLYCIDSKPDEMVYVSKVIHPCTGRMLEVLTNQNAVQFGTCSEFPDIGDPIIGKSHAIYAQYGGFYLATQNYPDAVNNCHFPCTLIKPKEKYCHDVIYRFGCCE